MDNHQKYHSRLESVSRIDKVFITITLACFELAHHAE